MAKINQVQVSYVPVEDRLLLRVSTDERQELRFWLTRRFTTLLRPALDHAAGTSGRAAMIPDVAARSAVVDFEREAALANADFSTPFESLPDSLPLGDAPVLLAKASVRAGPEGKAVLAMHPENGQGIDMAVDARLSHSLARLIDSCAHNAGWALDAEAAPTTSEPTLN